MTEYLEKLRGKPHHVRHALALWVSIMITLVVALIWATTLPDKLGGGNSQTAAADASPFSLIKQMFGGK